MEYEDVQVKLDPKRQERARVYARIRRRITLGSFLVGSGYLLLWVFFDWSLDVRSLLEPATDGGLLPFQPHWALQLMLFVVALALPWSLVDLPVSLYSGYILPHRFELSNQTLKGWISDQIKGFALSSLLGAPLLIGGYALLRNTPLTWWFWGALGYSLFAVLLTALAPLIIMPIFYRFRPLGDEHAALEDRLLRLSARAGTKVRGVYKFNMSQRTRAANAGLTGLGASRRIILGDTLLDHFSDDEIETILAHELAHHVHGDIPLGIAIQVPMTFLFFYLLNLVLTNAISYFGFSSLADPAALPLLILILSILGLLAMPLMNAWSRWRERMADAYALNLTTKPEAFISAMTRLANQNLADIDPEAWVVFLLHSHPPLRQRIASAQAWTGQAME